MIAACFSQPNTPKSSSSKNCSHQVPQNVVTCVYQAQLCNSPTHVTLSWSKTHFSHTLTVHAADIFSNSITINCLNPSSPTFSFFRSTRHRSHGSKSKSIQNQHSQKIKLHWNFARAEFIQNSAEPESRFYLAISQDGELQFFLGDLLHDLLTSTSATAADPVLLSRREHVFGGGRGSYVSRAVFMGSKHEIGIECKGGALRVKVDGETRLVVKRLAWKFRGYEKIPIDGIQVEFYWDVFSWVHNNDNSNGNGSNGGQGVFMFQVGDHQGQGTVWPEMVGAEKRLMMMRRKSGSGDSTVLQWAEENNNSSDSGSGRTSSSSSSSNSSTGSSLSGSNAGGAFSLLLYAWTSN